MTELILPRRKFLFGLAGAFAAPAIVKASSLMKTVATKDFGSDVLGPRNVLDVGGGPAGEPGSLNGATPSYIRF